MISPETQENESSLLSDQEAITFLENTIEKINFHDDLELFGGHTNVATQIAHWTLETFGQEGNDGSYVLYPGSNTRRDFHGEIPGEELPLRMRKLVSFVSRYRDKENFGLGGEFKREICFGGGNKVRMATKNSYRETEPVIPRREEIESFKTAKEAIAFIRANPGIIEGYQPQKVHVLPGVQIEFEHYYEWGLLFNVNPLGIECAPLHGPSNRAERIWKPTNFVIETYGKQTVLSEIVTRLSLLGARYTNRRRRNAIEPQQLETLEKRLTREENIPLIVENDFRFKPGNSLIATLLEQAQNPDIEI